MSGHGPEAMATPPPTVEEARLPPPRIALSSLPANISHICTDDKFERLLHCGGRDFLDLLRNINNEFDLNGASGVVDLVAFPKTDDEVLAVLRYCSKAKVACVIFGGGSSVAQGVEPPSAACLQAGSFVGCLSLDTRWLSGLREVDMASMSVRVGGGTFGPELEQQLRSHGLTFRYYPQSFEFSTVGGWIATRGGGHFATRWTHVDDMVQSVRVVTPQGITETARLPASGAGPAEHRLYIGSEGTLGVITEAWLQVRRRPVLRANVTLLFDKGDDGAESFTRGAEAVRHVVQAEMSPANLRLVDGPELSRMTGALVQPTTSGVLLGFEGADDGPSAQAEMDAVVSRAVSVCIAAGGTVEGEHATKNQKQSAEIQSWVRRSGGGERTGIAGRWGSSFMAGGYLFSVAAVQGMLLNTFETAITWDRFPAFHKDVISVVKHAIRNYCGGAEGQVTCRITHVYPDGPAPYYTVLVPAPKPKPTQGADLRADQWRQIKAAATEVMARHGATSTHHHSVGKLHRPHYEVERGLLFGASLMAMKRVHDPAMVLNPDVLIQTTGAAPAKSSELGSLKLNAPSAKL